jgi:hypothetical protein
MFARGVAMVLPAAAKWRIAAGGGEGRLTDKPLRHRVE